MKRTKNFVHLPEYPGGNEAFGKYIRENLIYPPDAIKQKIQGTVYLSAEVDDNGEIKQIKVDKGIGFGCDEEAIRLIANIKHGSVKNRGVRLKTSKRFTVVFKLPPETVINYQIVSKKPVSNLKTEEKKYSYNIKSE